MEEQDPLARVLGPAWPEEIHIFNFPTECYSDQSIEYSVGAHTALWLKLDHWADRSAGVIMSEGEGAIRRMTLGWQLRLVECFSCSWGCSCLFT